MLERELSPEEQASHSSLTAKFQALRAAIEREGFMGTPQPRAVRPDGVGDEPVVPSKRPYGSGVHGGMPVGTKKGSMGFRSMGDWVIAARGMSKGMPDQRIQNSPTTFGSEGVSSDGGFAVPPDFRENIVKVIQGEDQLLGMVDNLITSSNAISMPFDDSSPWQTSGGVLATWLGEGVTLSQSKPSLKHIEVKLDKLGCLVPVTEELMADAPMLTRWLGQKVPEKFGAAINDAIINGNGVSKPQGLRQVAVENHASGRERARRRNRRRQKHREHVESPVWAAPQGRRVADQRRYRATSAGADHAWHYAWLPGLPASGWALGFAVLDHLRPSGDHHGRLPSSRN